VTSTNGTKASGRMTLASIHRGKDLTKSDRILLYGTEGVGKSTFAASAPAPVFIAAEEGVKHLDVASFPEPETLADVLAAIRELRTTDHEYRTLVIDTIDWLEPRVFSEVIARNKDWKSIEDPGYGKGYAIALDEWRKVLADLDALRAERGMEVILLAHAQSANFSNPAGPDFARYELAMNKKGAALMKQWADSVLFACYEEMVQKEKGELKAKGISTGARVIHTEHRAAWDAKNRHSLPPVIPLSYDDYAAHRSAGQTATPEVLAAQLDGLLAELNPAVALRSKIDGFVGNRTDAVKLAQAVNRVRALIQEASHGA
jgi:hypothetical protein